MVGGGDHRQETESNQSISLKSGGKSSLKGI